MSMSSIVAKVNGQIDVKVRKATIELFSSVVKGTPVDTGRARGNWQCSVGSAKTDQTDRLDQSGSTVVADIVSTVPEKVGSIVWLSNNVPYIRKLEYGASKQAPDGMVRINIQRFAGILRSA